MSKEMTACEICEKKVETSALRECHGCGKKYCEKCQSESTNQNYCRECVGLKGVVPH
jgi:hypothetical protein